MNKCPFCKQEIKEQREMVTVKINGKTQEIVERKEIVRKSSGYNVYRYKGVPVERIPVLEVESK